MNYADHSEIIAHLRSIKRENTGFAYLFGRMQINEAFEITFYASPKNFCFCSPLETYICILDYKSIQISIDELIGPQDLGSYKGAIAPQTDDRFSGFDWTKYFVYTDGKGIVKPSYMGKYVPIEVVPKIVHDVYRMSCLKAFY